MIAYTTRRNTFVLALKVFFIMSVMLQSLNNIRTLRAMAREFSIDVLEEMLEKFRVVTKERREEEEQQQRELAERQEKISTAGADEG